MFYAILYQVYHQNIFHNLHAQACTGNAMGIWGIWNVLPDWNAFKNRNDKIKANIFRVFAPELAAKPVFYSNFTSNLWSMIPVNTSTTAEEGEKNQQNNTLQGK